MEEAPPFGGHYVTPSRWGLIGRLCGPTVRYWMETEVHVYAFSVAANVLLSFFPFLIVMVSLCRYVLHWRAAEQAVYFALQDYFPDTVGTFIVANLKATIYRRGPFQYASVLLLLFTANGIFEPLEVALNRVWGVKKNRTFLRNQLVSLGLIFLCGSLALLSITLTAMNRSYITQLAASGSTIDTVLSALLFKLAAVPIAILVLFLIYWLLPNRRVPPLKVLPVAIFVGLTLEGLKYLNLLLWPAFRAKLLGEYGPFVNSAALVFWGFIVAMVILAGAEWSSRAAAPRQNVL